jgi:hypothetical protein
MRQAHGLDRVATVSCDGIAGQLPRYGMTKAEFNLFSGFCHITEGVPS